jgi:hypothetical protein
VASSRRMVFPFYIRFDRPMARRHPLRIAA